MNYNELYNKFKLDIPECNDFCLKEERKNMLDETDGIHIFFGMVFVSYFLYIINAEKTETIQKVSNFMEEMARGEDAKIQEVLDFTILEQLADEGHEKLEQCKKYMQEKTLEHCLMVEKYFY